MSTVSRKLSVDVLLSLITSDEPHRRYVHLDLAECRNEGFSSSQSKKAVDLLPFLASRVFQQSCGRPLCTSSDQLD